MTPRMRVLVVDDEPVARRGLCDLVRADPELEVAGEASNGREALQLIESLDPDIVLLDVQMPVLDGFGVLRAIEPAEWPLVIFVTAYDAYAIDAFEMSAVDYLLKPFADGRARAALDRAKARLQQNELAEVGARVAGLIGASPAAPPAAGNFLDRIACRNGDRISFVDVQSIDWIEAADDYVRLHAGTARHLLRGRLRELQAKLDPRRFARIHRSAIVNLDRIRELRPLFHGDYTAVLTDGTELKVSRTHARDLAARTGEFF